jgi:hypothetical protein
MVEGDCTATVFRLKEQAKQTVRLLSLAHSSESEDGSSKYLPDYMTSHPRKKINRSLNFLFV